MAPGVLGILVGHETGNTDARSNHADSEDCCALQELGNTMDDDMTDGYRRLGHKHTMPRGSYASSNRHVPRRFCSKATKSSVPRQILGISLAEIPVPDIGDSPLSPKSAMTSSTRSATPEYGYSFARASLHSLPSVDGVLHDERPSSETFTLPRSRTPAHNRSSMSIDSAVVLEMDDRSVRSADNDKDDSLSLGDDQDLGRDDILQDFDFNRFRRPDTASSIGNRLERLAMNDSLPDSAWPAYPSVIVDTEETDDDTDTIVSDEGSVDDTDRILALSLPVVLGMDVEDIPDEAVRQCRDATSNYTSIITRIVHQCINSVHKEAPATAPSDTSEAGTRLPTSRNNSAANQRAPGARGKTNINKRRRSSNDDMNEEDEEEEEDSLDGNASARQKRANTGLRLRCVFRARNPTKFNVRDHYSCAMSYFSCFADLRKHILKKHSRADNQNFVCARCSKGFETKKILQEHLKAPVEVMCDPADPDPEDGIDSTTAKRIIDRRRKSSGSTEQDQWNDLWLLVFPDDSIIPSFEFQAVIEHYELAETYQESLQYLQPSLQGFGLGQEAIVEICKRILENFRMTMDSWDLRAREMDYANRQNNRSGAPRSSVYNSNEPGPARDSGVFMEVASTRSNSFIRPSSGTPASGIELLPRSSTGSLRSQERPVRRSSSVVYQQPRPYAPAQELNLDLLQSMSNRPALSDFEPMGSNTYSLPTEPARQWGEEFQPRFSATHNPASTEFERRDANLVGTAVIDSNSRIGAPFSGGIVSGDMQMNVPYHLVSMPGGIPMMPQGGGMGMGMGMSNHQNLVPDPSYS